MNQIPPLTGTEGELLGRVASRDGLVVGGRPEPGQKVDLPA